MSKIENLTDLCRICLVKSENMHPISEIDPKTIELLTFSLNFKLNETFTSLSDFCDKCKEKLDNFVDLLQTARETQDNLENWCRDEDINEENLNDTSPDLNLDLPRKVTKEFSYDDIMISIKNAKSVLYDNLKCTQCDFIGINIKALISHVSVVHREIKDKWCPVCNDLFEDLKLHKKMHDVGDLTCKFCSKTFTVNEYLVKHLLSHTNVVKIERRKKSERKTKSKGENCKLCNVCGKQFSNSSKLLTHLRSHSDEAPFSCGVCNKKLKSRSHLRQHENLHRDFRPYLCNICSKSFNQSSTLRTHLKLHGEKDKRCSICEKSFCRISDLKIHLRTHTGEKPFRCRICNSSFVQKSHLSEHEKKHLDVKPYKCVYCEKSFAQKSTLKSHIDIHLGVKSYRCNLCPYAARQSYVLKTHMKQHDRDFGNSEEI